MGNGVSAKSNITGGQCKNTRLHVFASKDKSDILKRSLTMESMECSSFPRGGDMHREQTIVAVSLP